MTATTPVERVATALEAAQFTRMSTPLEIAGMSIPVTSAFIGRDTSQDLVIIGDTVGETQRKIQQTIEGVGRALDMVQSRRPLTVVVVGPRPDTSVLGAMARVARVLPIGEVADQETIDNWLAVLRPLSLPKLSSDPVEVAQVLGPQNDAMVQALIAQAQHGEAAVRNDFTRLIEEPFEDDSVAAAEDEA